MEDDFNFDYLETVSIDTQEVNGDDITDDEYEEVVEQVKRTSRYLDKIEINKFAQNTDRLKTLLHIARSFCPGYNLYVRDSYNQQDGDMPEKVKKTQDMALNAVFRQIKRICDTDISLP